MGSVLEMLYPDSACLLRIPYFTAHDASHSEAIEKNLNQIIWGTEKEPLSLTQYDFVPTPEEATYLLIFSVWEVGKMVKGETVSDLSAKANRGRS